QGLFEFERADGTLFNQDLTELLVCSGRYCRHSPFSRPRLCVSLSTQRKPPAQSRAPPAGLGPVVPPRPATPPVAASDATPPAPTFAFNTNSSGAWARARASSYFTMPL